MALLSARKPAIIVVEIPKTINRFYAHTKVAKDWRPTFPRKKSRPVMALCVPNQAVDGPQKATEHINARNVEPRSRLRPNAKRTSSRKKEKKLMKNTLQKAQVKNEKRQR